MTTKTNDKFEPLDGYTVKFCYPEYSEQRVEVAAIGSSFSPYEVKTLTKYFESSNWTIDQKDGELRMVIYLSRTRD